MARPEKKMAETRPLRARDNVEKKKGGRKSLIDDYLTDDGLLLLEGWARDGIPDKVIAKNKIGISESTFSQWKLREPVISSALKKGRAPVAEEIESTMYDMCRVQIYKDTVEEITTDANGKVISKHKRITTREVAPNSTLIIFALKNLKPEKWRDRQIIGTDNEGQLARLIDGLKGKQNG